MATSKKSRKTSQEEELTFVIARPWKDPKHGLCIYAYHTELQKGTLSGARKLLKYIQSQTEDLNYAIYTVGFTKIK